MDLNAIPFIAASHHGGTSGGTPRLVVIHSMENAGNIQRGQAHACANYFAGPTTPYQAHYCVDPGEVYQCVQLNTVAYHVGNGNWYAGGPSIGIEQSGAALNTRDQWLTPDGTSQVNLVADLASALCNRFGIPKVYLSIADVAAGKPGITSHNNCSKALGGSDHTDPGANYPWDVFIARVNGGSVPAPAPVIPPAPTPGSKSMITIAQNADGRLEVIRVTEFGTVQHAWQLTVNGVFSAWTDMGIKGITHGVAAVIDKDGRIEVFAYGDDYSVYHCWQVVPNGSWSGWLKL